MKKAGIFVTVIVIIALLNGGFGQPSKYEGKIVKKIEFTGLLDVDEEDLLDVMTTEVGYPLRAVEIREDIKKIFKTGKFENIIVETEEYQDGVAVRFVCTERPIVNKIIFKGVEEVSETTLKEELPIKEGDVYRKDKVEMALSKIRNKYETEGLFNAIVKYKVEEEKDEKNAVNVIFIVDEGEDIKVQKIAIVGNTIVPLSTLKGLLQTEEEGLFADAKFNKATYEDDKAKILAYYRELGYLDADIVEDTVDYRWLDPETQEKRGIYITIKLREGERYYFDGYEVSGNEVFSTEEITAQFEQTKIGDPFNDTLYQKDRQMISFTYATKGYIFARIIPERKITEKEVDVNGKKEKRKFVFTHFHIKEGSQAYIENIIIKGNQKTKDKVIRRELVVYEGELFNSYKMQLSRERVYNLGFFKEVNFDVRPGSKEGYMNLIVDVVEQPSGTISLGGGWGSMTGFSIFADVAENNFMGNGQRISLRFEYGPLRNSITLGFNEPWLFDKPIGLNLSVFYMLSTIEQSSIFTNSNQKASHQTQQYGYSIGLNYRFWYYYGIGSVWYHAMKEVINASGNSTDTVFLEQAQGLQEKRKLTLYAYRDSKDNYLNPTRGWRAEFSASFTGGYIIRGDDHWVQYSPDLYWYFSPFHLPFLKTHPCVIELRFNGTFITPPWFKNKMYDVQDPDKNPWLESEDRLYIGGPETLRGWEILDFDFPDSWRYGLFHRILYGAEFRIPIHPTFLWFVFFFDAGSVWTDSFWEKSLEQSTRDIINEDKANGLLYDIRDINKIDYMSYFKYSYGFGFKIQIPMMPLRFWFGRKLAWVGRDDGYFKPLSGFQFQFGIGDMRF
ncbi:MAG: outer membrane protein assembly factor BamA [Spirochaetota bacterium]